MSKLINELSLVAILGLSACSLDAPYVRSSFFAPGDNLNSSIQNPTSQQIKTSKSNQNSTILSSLNYNKDLEGLLSKDYSSTSIGPFELSTDPDQESLKVGLGSLPHLEIRTQNKFEDGNSFDSLIVQNRRDIRAYSSEIDSWMLGNETYDNGEENQSIKHISKVFKYFLFDNVKPVKELSNTLQSPVTSVLGEKAKLDCYKRGDEYWARLKFGGSFGYDYSWSWGIEGQVSDDGETALFANISVLTGRKKVKSLIYGY